MPEVYRISPVDAKGQHDERNAFAYEHAGKLCHVLRRYEWQSPTAWGVRVLVILQDGATGSVWEDEIERLCECGVAAWSCMECGEA